MQSDTSFVIRPLARAAFFLACLILFPVQTFAQPDKQIRTMLPDVLHEAIYDPRPYRLEIIGDMAPSVREVLRSVSDTYALQDRPPATPEILERRARSDIPVMQRALRSEGFYDGTVQVRVDHAATPPLVSFEVDTGPAYVLQAVHFDGPAAEEEFDFPTPTAAILNLIPGQRARAPEIKQGEAMLRDFFQEHGHPFPWVSLRETVVDHATRSITVHYAFNPGPQVRFGPVVIEGQERVQDQYIMDKLPWTRGRIFQASLLNTLRSLLMRDGLFTAVNVSLAQLPLPEIATDDGEVPVIISVVERVPRTVKSGASYETDRGLGVELSWEHRNLRGQAERLRTRFVLAQKEQALSADYRIPNFMDQRQSMEFSSEISKLETDSYEKKGVAVGATMFRQLDAFWTVSLGSRYRLSETTQFGKTQTYGLFSMPGELAWDKRNNVLDPTRGWRAHLKAEPYLDTLEPGTRFFKLFGGMSVYVPLLPEDRVVLAARGGLGSIMGETVRNLPPDERFYAGGGDTIRGYSYQSIGPEEDGEVVGGRSMVEYSLELRLRMKSNLGLVAFLDGGQVFEESQLQWEDNFFWGAGLGLRYFIDFAPIRLDVAFPLNKRDKDSAFQIYVSIGQAF